MRSFAQAKNGDDEDVWSAISYLWAGIGAIIQSDLDGVIETC